MALIDVGTSEMNRRARARGMTAVHSMEFDRAQEGVLKSWGPGHIGRMDAFIAASQAHDQGMTRGIAAQKIPARGIVREQISPRTDPKMGHGGSTS